MSHTVSHKSPLAITDKRWLIPNRLSIFKRAGANRGQKNWYCQVYISRDHRPIRSLKTTDEAVAEQEAYTQWAELQNTTKTRGSTSPKSIEQLTKKWCRMREELEELGRRGGSASNTRRHKTHIGVLLHEFCIFNGWKKPKDIVVRDFTTKYEKWRITEGWKCLGVDEKGMHKDGGNRKPVIPSKSTIFNEFQTIRMWMEQQVEDGLMASNIKLPVRNKFVPPPENDDDFDANPPFTGSDYRRITASYRRWIKKEDPNSYDTRLKKVIYWNFLINCSVGWRYMSEGLEAKWNWIKEITVTDQEVIKGKQVETLASKIRIIDRKRNKTRIGYFVHAHHIQDLWNFYKQCHKEDPNCFLPKQEDYMFINPVNGKRISRSQVYDIFKEIILADCTDLSRNYTVRSCRSYMITTRLEQGGDGVAYDLHKYTGHDLRVLQRFYERMDLAKNSSRGTRIQYNTGDKDKKVVKLF